MKHEIWGYFRQEAKAAQEKGELDFETYLNVMCALHQLVLINGGATFLLRLAEGEGKSRSVQTVANELNQTYGQVVHVGVHQEMKRY